MSVVEPYVEKFLQKTLSFPDIKILPLAGDASNRKYYRVVYGEDSWVLMKWDPFNPEDYPFLSVLNHFAKNDVHVPKVVGSSPDEGLMLLEDLGDLTLERKFWENQNQEKEKEPAQLFLSRGRKALFLLEFAMTQLDW